MAKDITYEAESGTKKAKEGTFNIQQDLDKDEIYLFEYAKTRIDQLKKTRTNHYGFNIDKIWADADKDYVPHRLRTTENRIVATDEDKGWRGALVTLGSSNWQSDVSQANVFVKIQIALSILIDQNPTGVFTPILKKFQATNELMKQLYQRSWDYAKSKAQLKLFVFNLAKYGWAVARTYPLKKERKVRVMKSYNPDDPEKVQYEEKTVVEYNDVFRENLDPRNVWIDDMAKPNNPSSVRDWCWRKVYDMDDFYQEFGKYKLCEKVQAGGTITETLGAVGSATSSTQGTNKDYQTTNLVEVYFFENKTKDMSWVIANGVPVVRQALQISDTNGSKKLSLWQTYWNLRHAESCFGIGIYEAIRYDQATLDRFRNMTFDQIALMIYKMFFYQSTQDLQNTGEIIISPGVGKQVLDPKNITWLEVPSPGKEAFEGIQMVRNDLDEASGITDPLLGQITGKTAFEIAQAKEAALKRLKNPLENILEALNEEAYITICLIQLLYSIPEVYQISDPLLIDDYLKETQADPELYERDENDVFKAKVYKEFPLNLDKDEEGNLIQVEDTKFFRVKPRFLAWEGIINVKAQSILTPSKQVEKALDLEFYNMYIPLITQIDQERMMAMQASMQSGQPTAFDDLPHGKTAKALAKLYDKDPRDVLPDAWLKEQEPMGTENQPLFVPSGGEGSSPVAGPISKISEGGPQAESPNAESFVSQPTGPQQPGGFIQSFMQKITSPFRKP